ncbi:YfhO family protein [Clostridium sp. P21]|uniref:YfhO family protein n=1 Tax=Clostridium muellerianum TaxID=2716538 RepID=A0A7Y0EE60_9CLOT|nr:GtrA family protein [Clostridium muellerianum]NMM61824.1 YfhO family protein [Clostridium muellerianum]
MKHKVKQYFNNLINKESSIYNFLRFGIIGVINTIHYYIWYLFLLWLKVPYVISHTIAFTFSMIGSYFLNCFFTFKVKPTLKKFIKYPLTTLANYLVSTFSLILLVKILKVNPSIAALLASIIPIPITFIMTHKILSSDSHNGKKPQISITKNLFAIAILFFFSLACHLYIHQSGKMFGKIGLDNASQLMYFVTFLQKSFISGQHFWSWSYGFGGDIFSEFSYYYTTSPFFYLMLILRKLGIGTLTLGGTVHWRLIFSIFRQFLSMTILYLLLKYEKKSTYTSLIGSAVYGGCISFIWFSLFFDFMADAYVWLPLTVLGWRIYENTKKWYLLVISAALTVANSFYFGFISFVFYIIFIIVFTKVKGKNIREKISSFFNSILKYAVFAAMAVGLSAVAFIPSVLAFLKTDRFSTETKTPLFHTLNYMLTIPDRFFFYASVLGFPLIILIIFVLPWKKLSWVTKRKTVLVGIFFLMFLTPYSGAFFNGLSYSSDRWFYLFIFAVAYALPDWLEENDKFKKVGFAFFSGITILSVVLYYSKQLKGFDFTIQNREITNIVNIVILSAGLICLLAVALKRYVSRKCIKLILNCIIVLCVMVGLITNSNSYLSIAKPDMTGDSLKNSCMENEEEKQIFSKLTPDKSEFYRAIFRNAPQENAPMSYGYYGTSTYNSMVDGNLHKWLKVDHDILSTFVTPSAYKNFDDRLFLGTFFGSKYIVDSKYDTPFSPYGYELIKQTDNYNVYENRYNVGFDLWYSNTMDKNTYNNMNVAQKDAVLLQTAVVDKSVSGLNHFLIDNSTSEIALDWSNAVTKNMKYKDGVLEASDNASMNIPIKNSKKNDNGEILFSMNLKPSDGQEFRLIVNNKITIKSEEQYPYVYPIYQYSFCFDRSTDVLKLNISKGKYKITDAHVWFNSYDFYKDWVNERNKYNMENLYVDGGKVKGTIKNNEKGIMAFNIPFNKGWSAKVDGKKQELIKVNGVLMGLVLEPGTHNVEMTYITPGLIIGSLITAAVLIFIIIFYIISNRRKKYVQ